MRPVPSLTECLIPPAPRLGEAAPVLLRRGREGSDITPSPRHDVIPQRMTRCCPWRCYFPPPPPPRVTPVSPSPAQGPHTGAAAHSRIQPGRLLLPSTSPMPAPKFGSLHVPVPAVPSPPAASGCPQHPQDPSAEQWGRWGLTWGRGGEKVGVIKIKFPTGQWLLELSAGFNELGRENRNI